MTDLEVPLGSIQATFQGAIPSLIATVSADGTPNSTYVSAVWYVDDERVAISNQFLGKTLENLQANPHAAIIVVDPATITEYALDVTHLRSEHSGEAFEAVRSRIEAVAAQSGMEDVFRLRAIEVMRVESCAPVHGAIRTDRPTDGSADLLGPISIFSRRLSECRDLDEATRVALESLEDLFGFGHSSVLVADPAEKHLLTIATNGFETGEVDAEVAIDEGMIGVAASRRRQIRITNVQRMALGSAVPTFSDAAGRDPGARRAQSMVATPLILHDHLIGILYLDSEEPDLFDADAGVLIDILAGQLAATVALLSMEGLEPLPGLATGSNSVPGQRSAYSTTLTFYDHDGTVMLDGDYIIKGVPGRILFALLSEYYRSGRVEFTNREIRLDKSIGLPAGNDNLEARLLALRRRLADRSDPFHLERVGRGRLLLTVDGEVALVRAED